MVLSYLLVAVPLVTLTPQSRGSNGSTLTCDATQIHADSYRLTTEAQALNLTRPRTNWWDAFEVTLSPYRDALADINEGAWRSLNERSKSTIATCLEPSSSTSQQERVRANLHPCVESASVRPRIRIESVGRSRQSWIPAGGSSFPRRVGAQGGDHFALRIARAINYPGARSVARRRGDTRRCTRRRPARECCIESTRRAV